LLTSTGRVPDPSLDSGGVAVLEVAMLTNWFAYATHCQCCGTSQSGKSKWCLMCIRKHIVAGNGFCLLDWHGSLFDSVVNYLAYLRPNWPIYVINPSSPDLITPFNPLALPDGADVSTHVARTASLFLKPWGGKIDDMPTYERTVKMMLTFMAETGEPLQHAAQLLDFKNKDLRAWALTKFKPGYERNQFMALQQITALKDWDNRVLSTENRLGRFLSSSSIMRFMGHKESGISIADCIRQKAIVLVNLTPSYFLDEESARVFAALLLSAFLLAGLQNIQKPKPYYLYLDECEEYLTDDATKLLDQALKSGLRLTLIHHHLDQFLDKPALQKSIDMNAKIKVIFAGEPMEESKRHGEEFYFAEANERVLKETRYRYVTDYVMESAYTESETHGEIPGGHTHSTTDTTGSHMVPFQRKEKDGQEDWSRDEKIAKLAARFMVLKQRECIIKTPREVYEFTVPFLRDPLHDSGRILRYIQSLSPNAFTPSEADQRLIDQDHAFIERSRHDARISRPKKKPATLHPAG
jgi:hypothetical protein